MWSLRPGMVGFMVLAAGCGAANAPPQAPAPEQGAVEAPGTDSGIPVEISDQNFNDMDIYLIGQGAPVYLGSVTSYATTMLDIPTAALTDPGQVRLLAHPVGGAAEFRTPNLLVSPGKSVHWTIGTDAATSYASVA